MRPRKKQTPSVLEVFGGVQGAQGALRWQELHDGTTPPPSPFTDNTKAGNKTLDMKRPDKGETIYGRRFEKSSQTVLLIWKKGLWHRLKKRWNKSSQKGGWGKNKMLVSRLEMKPCNRSIEGREGVMPCVCESLRKQCQFLIQGKGSKGRISNQHLQDINSAGCWSSSQHWNRIKKKNCLSFSVMLLRLFCNIWF